MEIKLADFVSRIIQKNRTLQSVVANSSISYGNKVTILKKVLNKNQLVYFAILCAQSVQHIFEEKYPEDKSVANLLNYLSEIKDFNNLTDEQRQEIIRLKDAAYYTNAADTAAYYAAYTAYYATDNATDNANDAVNDAAYYAAYYAANAAAYAANATAENRKQQEELNLEFLKKAIDM